MPSQNCKLNPSRDPMTILTQRHGEFLAGGKTKGSFAGWSFGLRHLCILGTLFVVFMGLLSTSYLGSSFQVLTDQNSDSRQARTFPLFPSFIDAAASDRWLKISQEDSAEALPFPGAAAQGGSKQEDGSSTDQQRSDLETGVVGQRVNLPRDKSIGVQESGREGLTSPFVQQTQMKQDEVYWLANQSADVEVAKSLSKTREDQEVRLELFPKDRKQIRTPKNKLLDPSDENVDEDMVDKTEALERSRAEVILHQSSQFNSTSSKGKCDLTAGKWAQDPTGPLYDFGQCRILSQSQNCQQNGRPDKGYEFYKWQPEHCSVPRFDPNAFLELMRGKTLAFVGDSLARNQMESLMCILLHVADAKSKGSKNVHRWYFPSHKFTVARLWSSWLVQTTGQFPPLAPPNVTNLNLTELDDYAYHLPKFDVTILSSGHWWVRKTAYFMNGEMLGGVGWPWLSSHGARKMDNVKAFGVAVNTALQKVGAYPGYKGLTILRTYTPDHYSGGSWDTGGSCTGETKPYDKAPENSFNEMMYHQQLKAFQHNTKGGHVMPNGSKLRLLDVYPILNYRGDGHPGPYRSMDPLKKTTRDARGRPPPQDCLHWCMPGPIDSMNELLFQMLREELQ